MSDLVLRTSNPWHVQRPTLSYPCPTSCRTMSDMVLSFVLPCPALSYNVQPCPTHVQPFDIPCPSSSYQCPTSCPTRVETCPAMWNLVLPMSNPLSYHVQPRPTRVQPLVLPMVKLVLPSPTLSYPTSGPTHVQPLVPHKSNLLSCLVLLVIVFLTSATWSSAYPTPCTTQVRPCPSHVQPLVAPG